MPKPPTTTPPSFTLLTLASGGGPCETSTSGYLLKPFSSPWTDGFISIEGGVGVGSLETLLEEEERRKEVEALAMELERLGGRKHTSLAPPRGILTGMQWPAGCNSPTIKAGYLFSFLTTYVITHAHLDHISSMILSTGTLPSRLIPVPTPDSSSPPPPILPSSSVTTTTTAPLSRIRRSPTAQATRRCVYAETAVLEEIAVAFAGEIWPELAVWPPGYVPGPAAKRSAVARRTTIGTGSGHAHQTGNGYGGPQNASISEGMVRKRVTRSSASVISNAAAEGDTVAAGMGSPGRRKSFASLGKKLLKGASAADEKFPSSAKTRGRDGNGHAVGVGTSAGKGTADGEAFPNNKVERPAFVREPWGIQGGVGVQLCPVPSSGQYQSIPFAAPSSTEASSHGISIMHMPVAHGHTSCGLVESSAFFIRLDEDRSRGAKEGPEGMEFLFWGDVESRLGSKSEEEDMNRRVWKEAARRWDEGRLGAVFIECSFDDERAPELMFGHLKPTVLHAELATMASYVGGGLTAPSLPPPPSPSTIASHTSTSSALPSGAASGRPLDGLKVYIIHVKETFVLDPGGRTIHQRIMQELLEAEEKAGKDRLGVVFVQLDRGMEIVI